ncbi:hypothetical protein GW676_14410 [Escherichia marmotae]|nr:hypothetical protein [Escherichia coli]MBC6525868.1 hypothetical protein [Escherichia marmotae]EFA4951254.1 hypothetical protein [Escherichia coli]EFB2836641.1 hypothetical protein [Escherichia coli]EFO1361051.1 hypothetical protein [Escherichia coli]
MPLPIIASLTLLIFASISFLLPPTLTIQQPHLLMQIKFTFIYLLRSILLICINILKLRNCLIFRVCAKNRQNKRV